MELYTEEELRDLLDEAYAMGQQDLVDYIDEAYEEDFEEDDGYSLFDRVMSEGSNSAGHYMRKAKALGANSYEAAHGRDKRYLEKHIDDSLIANLKDAYGYPEDRKKLMNRITRSQAYSKEYAKKLLNRKK